VLLGQREQRERDAHPKDRHREHAGAVAASDHDPTSRQQVQDGCAEADAHEGDDAGVEALEADRDE
jgi:hypothetical protein